MTYCPICGTELDVVTMSILYCPKCHEYYVIHVDSEWGDFYTLTRIEGWVGEPIAKHYKEHKPTVYKFEKSMEG